MNDKTNLNEIARILNISTTTVSRALSGTGRVSKETRKKVIEIAEELGYSTPSQRRLDAFIQPTNHSHNIGVVMARDLLYESDFFHQCLLGAASALADHNYETLLILCNTDEYEPLRPAAERGDLDGVIFLRAISGEKSHPYLKKKNIPVVVVGSGVKNALMVDSNNLLACRELCSNLVNCGCKNISFICGNINYTVNKNRLDGVLMGMTDYRLEPNPNIIFKDIESFSSCKIAVETAIQRRADGIICGDEVTTIWTYDILTQNGISVPKDILLASCYDSKALSHHSPTISAVHVDARKMGIEAGEAMCRLLSGTENRRFIPVEHTIHLRESTRSF